MADRSVTTRALRDHRPIRRTEKDWIAQSIIALVRLLDNVATRLSRGEDVKECDRGVPAVFLTPSPGFRAI